MVPYLREQADLLVSQFDRAAADHPGFQAHLFALESDAVQAFVTVEADKPDFDPKLWFLKDGCISTDDPLRGNLKALVTWYGHRYGDGGHNEYPNQEATLIGITSPGREAAEDPLVLFDALISKVWALMLELVDAGFPVRDYDDRESFVFYLFEVISPETTSLGERSPPGQPQACKFISNVFGACSTVLRLVTQRAHLTASQPAQTRSETHGPWPQENKAPRQRDDVDSLRADAQEAYARYGDSGLFLQFTTEGDEYFLPGGPQLRKFIGSFYDDGRVVISTLVHLISDDEAERTAALEECLRLARRIGAWYIAAGKFQCQSSPHSPATAWAAKIFAHLPRQTPQRYDPFWASLEALQYEGLTPTDARNCFAFEAWESRQSLKEIWDEIKRHPEWEQFDKPLYVRGAISAWARKIGKVPRKGKPGRPKQPQ